MTEISGREPGLHQDSPITGDEPQLGGERREKPVYWTGIGVMRKIAFTFVPVREQTPLEITRMLQRGEPILLVGEQRRILLQPFIYRGDTIQHRDNEMPRVTAYFIGWASEDYPSAADHPAHRIEIVHDITSYELTFEIAPSTPSPYFSDII